MLPRVRLTNYTVHSLLGVPDSLRRPRQTLSLESANAASGPSCEGEMKRNESFILDPEMQKCLVDSMKNLFNPPAELYAWWEDTREERERMIREVLLREMPAEKGVH